MRFPQHPQTNQLTIEEIVCRILLIFVAALTAFAGGFFMWKSYRFWLSAEWFDVAFLAVTGALSLWGCRNAIKEYRRRSQN